MANKRKRADHSRTPNRPTVVRRHVERPSWDPETLPLIRELKRGLYADHPVELLHQVSTLMVVTEERPGHEPGTTLEQLVDMFLDTDVAPTTAALHVIAAFADDKPLTVRIRAELARRTQPMPKWLLDLPTAEIGKVWETREELRDGEDYLLDVRLPDGYRMSAIVYVDNNMGQIVKDAFAVPEPMETVLATFEEEPELEVSEVDPAWARARMEQAVDIGARTIPPAESETWPAARPMVRWLLRLLPEGGELEEWEEWSDEEKAALIDGFLASRHGAGFDDADHRSLLDDLVWFGNGWGTGDPLRWSPVNVEILLADWFPRKVVADVDLLEKLPGLLRAFIRYAHAERSVRPHRTAETLAAVDRWEPEYQRLIRTDRPQGAEALARMLLDYSNGADER